MIMFRPCIVSFICFILSWHLYHILEQNNLCRSWNRLKFPVCCTIERVMPVDTSWVQKKANRTAVDPTDPSHGPEWADWSRFFPDPLFINTHVTGAMAQLHATCHLNPMYIIFVLISLTCHDIYCAIVTIFCLLLCSYLCVTCRLMCCMCYRCSRSLRISSLMLLILVWSFLHLCSGGRWLQSAGPDPCNSFLLLIVKWKHINSKHKWDTNQLEWKLSKQKEACRKHHIKCKLMYSVSVLTCVYVRVYMWHNSEKEKWKS